MKLYNIVTGKPVSAFTMDELMSRGLSLEEAAWLVWGVLPSRPTSTRYLKLLHRIDSGDLK